MANDSSIGAAVVVTANRARVAKSKYLAVTDLERGNTAPQSDERDVWLAILQDWKNKALAAGLNVEVYDARPHEQAFVIVVTGASYHADCDRFSRGNVCAKCGRDVVTDVVTSVVK